MIETGDPGAMMNVVGRESLEIPSSLPKPVRLALAKALAKKQDERFVSCAEFFDAMVGKVAVSRNGKKSPLPKIVGVLLTILGQAGGVWYWQDEQAIAAERNVEAEVFRLSANAQSAHDLIWRESAEIKDFFASEINTFENDRRAGEDAKSRSKNVIATNFYAKAILAATALRAMVAKCKGCKI